MGEHTSKRRQRPGLAVLVPLALLASSAVVYQASNAAFTATTSNAGNSWTTGTVALTDNDSGTALFTVTNAKPGDTGTKCIVVTYSGTLASAVKMYGATYTGTLGQYLNLTVDEGSGTAANCSDFAGGSQIYNGTVDGFATTKTSYGTGVSSWAPAAAPPNTTKTYKIVWTLQDNNAAQGLSAGLEFKWEAQNS